MEKGACPVWGRGDIVRAMKRFIFSLLACATTSFAGDFSGDAGLQLYSLRDIFKKDAAGALDQVKAFGVKSVETYNTPSPAPTELRKLLDERGIKAVSGHFGYDMFQKDSAAVVASAKALASPPPRGQQAMPIAVATSQSV